MLCSVCKKNRETVTPKQSKLLPSTRLFLCNACLDGGFEPRYLIILTARGGDMTTIKPYIAKHLYVGDKITAEELIA